jgi:hypothetical protein
MGPGSTALSGSGDSEKVNVSIQNSVIEGREDICDLGIAHRQCSNARATSSMVEVISLSPNSYGASAQAEPVTVGALNARGDGSVVKTFRGARTKRGMETVNQSVTLSIDPRNLRCLSCVNEHFVFQGGNRPILVFLCDQNYLAMWPGTDSDKCVVVIRMLNPSLLELIDLLMEVMDRRILPDGSVVLVSSVSHLQRGGVSVYCRDWVKLVTKLGNKWPNVRVGPLPPPCD